MANQIKPIENKSKNNSLELLRQGSVSLVDLIAPPSVEVDFRYIRVGEKYYRTYFVVDYPRFVSPDWLSILIDHKQTMNISMFAYPMEREDILSNLKRKIAEMEATIDSDMEQGLEADPKVKAALEDAMALQEELAKGIERFFLFGLYITLSANSVAELDQKSKELVSLLASSMIIIKPATLQMEDGFKTTLPTGIDKIFITRNMDTTSLGSTFPFSSYEISHPNGILYGINTLNNSLAIIDRFYFENANEVVFGKSGSGKSFLVKLEVLRQTMFGTEVIVLDPEEEYKSLTHSLGGEYISFSPNSEIKINPFSLVSEDMSETQLGIKILSLHSLMKTMLGDMNPIQEAILDRALVLTYKQKGITTDPATYQKEPPLLEDLYKTLLNMEENEAKDLVFRLEKYIKGGFGGLFNEQTNYDVKNLITVFSLKEVEETLRPVAMHMILDFIWNKIRVKLKKRILIVDEAWYLMKYPDSAAFLQGIVKRARKYYLGVTTLTQDVEDFLSNDYGKTILSNSSIQILLRQSPTEIDLLTRTFKLSDNEKQFLLTTGVGVGLMFAGQNHITTHFLPSKFEYNLITSKPQDILKENEVKNTPVFEKKEGSQENQQAINSAPKQTPEPLIKYEKREDLSYDPSLRNTPLVLNNSSVFKKDEDDQVAQNTGINPEPANTNPQQEEQNTPQEVKITDAPPNDTKISMVAEINQPAQEQIQSKQNIQSSISSQNLNVNQATPPPQNIAEPQPEKRRFGFFSELKNIDYNEK